jgi:leucyl/phenylalanyl-tRNA--protein transferase
MIFRLDDRLIFPGPELAEEDGLLAVGGDLSTERLLLAYQSGIFPWYSDDTPILWYSPHERCVLYPDELKVSKSMKAVLRSDKFRVTVNQCFDKVIAACSSVKRDGQNGTWITDDMMQAYIQLNLKGFAHSVEVWQQDSLVGGLYGVQTGKVFCGESMFSLVSNASKVALVHLCAMGARMISREEYMRELNGE